MVIALIIVLVFILYRSRANTPPPVQHSKEYVADLMDRCDKIIEDARIAEAEKYKQELLQKLRELQQVAVGNELLMAKIELDKARIELQKGNISEKEFEIIANKLLDLHNDSTM